VCSDRPVSTACTSAAIRPSSATALETSTRSRAGSRPCVQVINGGVPGYSTAQSIERLEETGWATAPDLLVIGNLWSDAARSDRPDREHLRAARRRGLTRARLAVDHALNRLAFYRFVKIRMLVPRPMARVDNFGVPEGLPRRVGLPEYEANLRSMIGGAKRRGADAVLLVLPHAADQLLLRDRPRELVRADVRARGNREIEQDYRETMRRVAADTATPLVDLAAAVATVPDELFLDEFHPNARGHALIAETLRGVILPRLQLVGAEPERAEAGRRAK
jgi:lysophospholipase L1-like esterase